RLAGSPVEIAGGRNSALGVVCKKRRDFQRSPTVDAVGPGKDWSKQIRGARQVGKCERKEQVFFRPRRWPQAGDIRIVSRAFPDRLIENRRVRGEAGYGELADVVLQRAAVKEIAGNIVEPEALSEIVEFAVRVHGVTFKRGRNLRPPPAHF